MNKLAVEKIDKQVQSLRKKIEALSGDYPTNTPKRQREQRDRDTKTEKLRAYEHYLEFLCEESFFRWLTPFELSLLTGTFFDETRRLLDFKTKGDSIAFDACSAQYRKQLSKSGIRFTEELNSAVGEFGKMLEKAVIPTDPKAAKIRDLTYKARLNQSGDIQFTPSPLAKRLVEIAGIQPNDRVLEPSAGIGFIADEVKKITPGVDCIEYGYSFRELLELKGHNVIGSDLFECEPRPEYGAVIMNPPFSEECEHIRHAFGFVKTGGILVSICCVRIQNSDKKQYLAFREWLSSQDYWFEEVSEKFEMTGTSSVILAIRKGA
jgi:hypothetical protein